MTLYSKNGGYPQLLPDRDTSGEGLDGLTWTDLPNNTDGRAACGWEAAPDAPAYDPEAATLSWADGAWMLTPLSAEQISAQLQAARAARLANLALLRWDKMQSVVVDGQALLADDVTVGRCVAAKEYAAETGLDLDAPRNWKVADGVWTTLSTNQIAYYGVAIGTHWQACFDRELELSNLLMAATDLASLRAVDISAGWPA